MLNELTTRSGERGNNISQEHKNRAWGCLLGQVLGAALSRAFPYQIEPIAQKFFRNDYALGKTTLHNPAFDSMQMIALSYDTVLFLALARSLITQGEYRGGTILNAYLNALTPSWATDEPTTEMRQYTPSPEELPNDCGALVRTLALGLWGAFRQPEEVIHAAQEDAQLSHPHGICRDACALYAVSLSLAIRHEGTLAALFKKIRRSASASRLHAQVLDCLNMGPEPREYEHLMLSALHNALWQLRHTAYPDDGLEMPYAFLRTVANFGQCSPDATEVAICGALLGALHGAWAFPRQWRHSLSEHMGENTTLSLWVHLQDMSLHLLESGLGRTVSDAATGTAPTHDYIDRPDIPLPPSPITGTPLIVPISTARELHTVARATKSGVDAALQDILSGKCCAYKLLSDPPCAFVLRLLDDGVLLENPYEYGNEVFSNHAYKEIVEWLKAHFQYSSPSLHTW